MLIGICDEDESIRNRELSVCKKVLDKYSLKCKIRLFSDGSNILNDALSYDLIVMDTKFSLCSGIDIKNILQDKGENTKIIFVSNHTEYMSIAFGLHVIGFVSKNKIETELLKILDLVYKTKADYTLLNGEFDSREIMYIKSEGVYNILEMSDGKEMLIRDSLAKCEEELKRYDFIRIHKSYIVNAKWVTGIGDKTIYLGDVELPVSVRMWSEVKRKYREYSLKRIILSNQKSV